MGLDEGEIEFIVDGLEMLLEDLNSRARDELTPIIASLKKANSVEQILKIMEDLEALSNTNVDSYARNELVNAIASLEGMVNS